MNSRRLRVIIDKIRQSDDRFSPKAYTFILRALDFTVERSGEEKAGQPPNAHVSCRDLLLGVCGLALERFGPMSTTVLKEWGIKNSYNVGEIVFQLIGAGVLSKQPSDSLQDFKSYLDLHTMLSSPYLPESQTRQK